MTQETEKKWESATFEGNCRAQLRHADVTKKNGSPKAAVSLVKLEA